MRFLFLMMATALAVSACARSEPTTSSSSSATAPSTSSAPAERECGLASFYSDALVGNPTASGEIYSATAATAAHRTLPFGTVIRVTRVSTGVSTMVRVNDRGPFVEGRVVDLSRLAADELNLQTIGVDRVCVTVESMPTASASETTAQ